jgi:hypothetical protein
VRLPSLFLAATLLVVAACADDDDEAAPAEAPVQATTTTVTGPPIVLGVVGALDLVEGQCYAPVPPPPEDPSTTTTSGPPEVTAVPSMIVADCAGPHHAQVYAAFCLAPDPAGGLVAGDCPGQPGAPWPGDREVRRAAVRLCLERFEATFGEPYATTRRTAYELVPTEGPWSAGQHRVVCAADDPEPAQEPAPAPEPAP